MASTFLDNLFTTGPNSVTVAIASRKAYFCGEIKPGFPVGVYKFSGSVTKHNEASYLIKDDTFLDQMV
jgi:hypothetical protein